MPKKFLSRWPVAAFHLKYKWKKVLKRQRYFRSMKAIQLLGKAVSAIFNTPRSNIVDVWWSWSDVKWNFIKKKLEEDTSCRPNIYTCIMWFFKNKLWCLVSRRMFWISFNLLKFSSVVLRLCWCPKNSALPKSITLSLWVCVKTIFEGSIFRWTKPCLWMSLRARRRSCIMDSAWSISITDCCIFVSKSLSASSKINMAYFWFYTKSTHFMT